jgi:hypothetical protein
MHRNAAGTSKFDLQHRPVQLVTAEIELHLKRKLASRDVKAPGSPLIEIGPAARNAGSVRAWAMLT